MHRSEGQQDVSGFARLIRRGLLADVGAAGVVLLGRAARVARHGADAFGICRNCSRTASFEAYGGGPLCKPRLNGFLSIDSGEALGVAGVPPCYSDGFGLDGSVVPRLARCSADRAFMYSSCALIPSSIGSSAGIVIPRRSIS